MESRRSAISFSTWFLFTFVAIWVGVPSAHAERPNILVVMVDDLGFSDVGCYGGEIETPNLDRLAKNGLRFSQLYNTAKCHSSRISLLTGCYALQAGDTSMKHAVTSAEVLSEAGYFTAMTGKWHLGRQPTEFGFQRYFGHLSGACNYFLGDKTFRLNGEPWKVPAKDFYTTTANVDFALEFLREARSTEKPWYLYVAFNAPHAPLQALEEDYQKYEGRYDSGWDKIRNARIEKQKQVGLFESDFEPSPRPDHIPAWSTLSPKRREWESKRMTTLAAMIDRVDQELGRLLRDVEAAGELDNTLVLFVSDNGACPYDRRSTNLDQRPTDGSFVWSDSTGWAWARNGPFRFYKQNQFEGGIATPAIVHWPAGLKTEPGAVVDQPAHLIDVLPTLVDICEAKIPAQFPERELRPIAGVSLRPVLEGGELTSRPPLHFLFASDRGLRNGDWKLVSFRSQPWELFNLKTDRAENNNVADQHPEIVKSMVEKWNSMSREVLFAPPRAYRPVAENPKPKLHPEWTDFTKEPAAGNGKRGGGRKGNRNTGPQRRVGGVRARKNTRLKLNGNELGLEFTGPDPGLAIDTIKQPIPRGPYALRFEIKSTSDPDGEVFFVTAPGKKLPDGERIPFQVQNNGEWQEVQLKLETNDPIQGFRLDVSSGPGSATVRNLRLEDANGRVLRRWPVN